VAAGSEKFSWKLFGDSEHTCWRCKRTLRVQDVAEERRVYPGRRYQFLCADCKRADVDAMIEATRARLQAAPPRS